MDPGHGRSTPSQGPSSLGVHVGGWGSCRTQTLLPWAPWICIPKCPGGSDVAGPETSSTASVVFDEWVWKPLVSFPGEQSEKTM